VARLSSIQALRGIAALLVLVFHIAEIQRSVIGTGPDTIWLSGWWNGGYSGVDLFFVISGFIMVYVTQNKAGSWRHSLQFLYARIVRIYPVWWVFSGIMALYFWQAYGVPADIERANISGGLGAYLLRSVLLLPQAAVPVLGLGWSLIHEVYFYLVFALILCVPRRYLVWILMI